MSEKESRASRQAREATYPKCRCGNTLGVERVKNGVDYCTACEREMFCEECEQLKERISGLEQELVEAREEKKRRVYYQDIVYRVCTALDVELRNSPGCGIVCGTAYNPNPTAVTDALSRALQQAEKRGFEAALKIVDKRLTIFNGQCEKALCRSGAWDDYLKAKRGEGDGAKD